MKDISLLRCLLVFGTDTGNTEEVGDKICDAFATHGLAFEMLNVEDATPEQLNEHDFIVMGIPTWDFGGIQEDWENFENQLQDVDFSQKAVALYGLGDQRGYGHYFVDAMGWLYELIAPAGAEVVGSWSTDGYFYEESRAVNAEKTYFVGLAVDDDQQFELTDERIASWVNQVIGELTGVRAEVASGAAM